MKILLKVIIFSFLVFSVYCVCLAEEEVLPIDNIRFFSMGENDSRLFLLNSDNTISIFDIETNIFSVVRKKVADRFPTGVFASPSGNYFATFSAYYKPPQKFAFVTIYTTDDFINSQSQNPTPTWVYSLDGWGIFDAAFTPDEKKLIITGSYSRAAWILNLDEFGQQKINFESMPQRLTVAKGSKRVFVIGHDPATFSVVSLKKGEIIKTKKLKKDPFFLIYDRFHNNVFVSNAKENQVMAYNVKTRKTTFIPAGAGPGWLALDEQTGTVFVANDEDGTITLIGADLKVITTLDIGTPAYQRSGPIKIFFSQNTRKLFIANTTASRYFFYDLDQGSLTEERKIPTLAYAYGITTSAQTSSVFLHGKSSNILQIDLQTGKENFVPEIEERDETIFLDIPMRPVVDDLRERLYISNLGNGKISVLNARTLEPITSFFAVNNPYLLKLNQKTQKLYVGSPAEEKVVVVDVSGEKFNIIATLEMDGTVRTMTPDTKRNQIYISTVGGKARITVVDGANDTVVATIDLKKAKFITGPKIIGKFLYVHDYGGDSIFVINLETNKLKKRIKVGAMPLHSVYISDSNGQRHLYTVLEGERAIAVTDIKSRKVIRMIELEARPYRLLYDGQYIYVNHRKNEEVTVIKPGQGMEAPQVIRDRPIEFYGELDTKYTQFIYSRATNLGYITVRRNSTVLAVRNQPEPETGIMNLVWAATINSDGLADYNPAFFELPITKFSLLGYFKEKDKITAVLAILGALIAALGVFLLIRRKATV